MTTTTPSDMLARAADPDVPALDRIADALTGLLGAIVEHDERETREEVLTRLHDEADAALGRVLELADWHETKAQKARAFPGAGEEHAARMAKAAEVHADAARRIREAVNGGDR